jgi:plastocyanin
MSKPGTIAFPVLLVLGAITGYFAYDLMVVKATPVEGNYDNSPYRKEITQSPSADSGSKPAMDADKSKSALPQEEKPIGVESDFAKVVTIAIPTGASVQGNTYYEPDSVTVPADALITWVNNDSTLHTATSGTGFDDENFGQLFDSSLIGPGKEFSIPASELGSGKHAYFCSAHPFMTGTVTVE